MAPNSRFQLRGVYLRSERKRSGVYLRSEHRSLNILLVAENGAFALVQIPVFNYHHSRI